MTAFDARTTIDLMVLLQVSHALKGIELAYEFWANC